MDSIPNRPLDAGINLVLQAAEERRVKALQLREKINRAGGWNATNAKLPPAYVDVTRARIIQAIHANGNMSFEEARKRYINNCGIPEEDLGSDSPWFKPAEEAETPPKLAEQAPEQPSTPAELAETQSAPDTALLPDNAKIPLIEDGKTPAIPDNWRKAKQGQYQIRKNHGTVLTAENLIMDFDPRNYAPGKNPYLDLADPDILPVTALVKSPHGFHRYFKKPAGIKIKKHQPKYPGVDFLSDGCYVVGPGSIVDGKPYKRLNNYEVAEIPLDFLDTLERQQETNGIAGSDGIETLLMRDSFIDLCKTTEHAVKGSRGIAAYKLACVGRDYGLPQDKTQEDMAAYWNVRCLPPLTKHELKTQVDHAYTYAKGMQGSETPEVRFKDVPLPEPATTGNATETEAKDTSDNSSEVEELIEYIDGVDFSESDFPEQRYAIKGLLPVGFTVLGAHPKVGKTFLALSLAVSISSGILALGKFNPERGKVLCLFFEDSKTSIQERYGRLLDENPASHDIEFCFNFPKGEKGLEELIKKLKANPDIRFVVADTLGIFLPVKASKLDAYQAQYPMYTALNRIAHKYNVAILATHHLSKGPRSTDPVTQLTGSMALAAAASCLWVLESSPIKGVAKLHIIPKEFEKRVLVLKFNEEKLLWEYTGEDATEIQLTEYEQKIIDWMRNNRTSGTPKKIAEGLGLEYKNVKSMIWKMERRGKIIRKSHGHYVVNDADEVFKKERKKNNVIPADDLKEKEAADEINQEDKRKTREALLVAIYGE